MNMHHADVMSRLSPFLRRKQMPKRFDADVMAQEAETRALCAAIARIAPASPEALSEWWLSFEIRLSEICGAMWPTEKEIRDAGKVVNTNRPKPKAEEVKIDEAEQIARKMQEGHPVGEGWIYGIGAVELASRRLIDRDTMQAYRSGAYFARVNQYDEEAARKWEAERIEAHEAAKEVWKHRDGPRGNRPPAIPNKSERPSA